MGNRREIEFGSNDRQNLDNCCDLNFGFKTFCDDRKMGDVYKNGGKGTGRSRSEGVEIRVEL
jgi:hypothetical protein